jgi:TatD DNase family protein
LTSAKIIYLYYCLMILIDTHTHLYSKEFDADRDSLIQTAIVNGIEKFYMPNVDEDSIPSMFQVEKKFPQHCFAMMGLHPCSVNQNYPKQLHVVEYWLSKRSFVAIGEIGIDLYWDKTFLEQQQDAFRTQIQLAVKYKLPYVIHLRNAFDEVMEIVNEFRLLEMKALFHCFSGTLAQAQQVIAAGPNYKLGIGGVVTFKNSGLDKVVEAIDISKIVLETDAPYLAPNPHRGKRNDPEYLLLIAKKIAEIKNMSVEEVAAITTKNAEDVFSPSILP